MEKILRINTPKNVLKTRFFLKKKHDFCKKTLKQHIFFEINFIDILVV